MTDTAALREAAERLRGFATAVVGNTITKALSDNYAPMGKPYPRYDEAVAMFSRDILALLDKAAAPTGEDWRDDPSADERWDAGCQFAMDMLCDVLGVDPKSVNWDAATETLDGDVASVIGNIMRAKYGDEWSARDASPPPVGVTVKPLEWYQPREHDPTLHADSLLGRWAVWDFDGKDAHYCPPRAQSGLAVGGDIEAAKAAAQSDFETRIRSALDV